MTFADKEAHQLFLEPEGETTNEYYLNGFSSSLPIDIQLEALRTIPAESRYHRCIADVIGLWPTLIPRDAVKLESHILEVK